MSNFLQMKLAPVSFVMLETHFVRMVHGAASSEKTGQDKLLHQTWPKTLARPIEELLLSTDVQAPEPWDDNKIDLVEGAPGVSISQNRGIGIDGVLQSLLHENPCGVKIIRDVIDEINTCLGYSAEKFSKLELDEKRKYVSRYMIRVDGYTWYGRLGHYWFKCKQIHEKLHFYQNNGRGFTRLRFDIDWQEIPASDILERMRVAARLNRTELKKPLTSPWYKQACEFLAKPNDGSGNPIPAAVFVWNSDRKEPRCWKMDWGNPRLSRKVKSVQILSTL